MRGEQITLHVRCRGGVSEPLILDRPSKSWETWMTPRDVVAEINGLLNSHTYPEIAAILNDRALRSGKGGTFTARTIARIQKHYQRMPRYDRLRAAGMLTLEEMAHALGVSTRTVHIWRVHGLVRGHAYTDKRDRLYEPPPTHAPKKAQGVKLSSRIRSRDLVPHGRKEVQCEA